MSYTTITEFQQVWSDFYKDAYGFRPKNQMPNWTLAEWEAEFNHLAAVCKENNLAQTAAEAEAVKHIEAVFDKLINIGAGNRATALRWLHTAHETGGDDKLLCYQLGLPFGYNFLVPESP